MAKMKSLMFVDDCTKYDCKDACCQHGVHCFPKDMKKIIDSGHGARADFGKAEKDEDGYRVYKTNTNEKGCIFLKKRGRGCRFHEYKIKPQICNTYPTDMEEAEEAYHKLKMLPCFAEHLRTGKKTEYDVEI